MSRMPEPSPAATDRAARAYRSRTADLRDSAGVDDPRGRLARRDGVRLEIGLRAAPGFWPF